MAQTIPPPSPKTGTPSVETKELQQKIFALKTQGHSLTQIGEILGYSQNYIYKLYKKGLKAIIFEDVDNYRKMELTRLDDLQAKAMMIVNSFHPLISGGGVVRDTVEDANGQPMLDPMTGKPLMVKVQDRAMVLSAINTVRGIIDQRAKLLGLNAPVKTAITNPDGTAAANLVQVYLPSNGRENYAEESVVEGEVIGG